MATSFSNTIIKKTGEVYKLDLVAKKHGVIDHAWYKDASGDVHYYSIGFYKFCLEEGYIKEQG